MLLALILRCWCAACTYTEVLACRRIQVPQLKSSAKLPRHLYPKHVELVSQRSCSKGCSDELVVLEGMARGESKVHKKLVQNR